MAVTLQPLPAWHRKIPPRLRPGLPPHAVFDSPPTKKEIKLARALFLELDPDSQDAFRSYAPGVFGDL